MSDMNFPSWLNRLVEVTIVLLLFLVITVLSLGLMEPILHWDIDSLLDQNLWLVILFSAACLSSTVGMLLIWGTMLWHCCCRLKPSLQTPRWIWLVVLLLGNFFGALLYYFFVRNRLLSQVPGTGGQAPKA